MPFFETSVQEIKYKVLKKVAELAYADQLLPENMLSIPEEIIPEGKPTMRCCIYKERAIINQRVAAAIGAGGHSRRNVRVLPIACDECPIEGIQVTHSCHGCIARYCANTCPKGAISIVNLRAQIDKTKCVECGQCLNACSYSAIVRVVRPCVEACKTRAIEIDPDSRKARINEEKCVSCGACVYRCPFGAITDESYITDVIRLIRQSDENRKYHVYAVIAPSIATQYPKLQVGQLVTALVKLGFYFVAEAAEGADLTAWEEAGELAEKGFLTSSCCPAFVSFVEQEFPNLKNYVSHTLSPMAAIARRLKEKDPTAKVVFIGPCIAKKSEAMNTRASEYVDYSLTFKEMQAMFGARNVDPAACENADMRSVSPFGRGFARCGGLAEAVREALNEQGVAAEQFNLDPAIGDGLAECRKLLTITRSGKLKQNFIEGMACKNGCVGGPASLTHNPRALAQLDRHKKEATGTIQSTVQDYDNVD